ncbi:hypothetical protein, partial [Pseudomonas sp. NCHU5216]|uniref:hypothetical protein n=1 Tax=Pseudomonas sp. NCHU5216 TaxID=3451355 RepID=UPI003F950651
GAFLLLTFLCAVQRKVSRPRGRNPESLKTPKAASKTPKEPIRTNTQPCQSGIKTDFPEAKNPKTRYQNLAPGFQGSPAWAQAFNSGMTQQPERISTR